MKNYKSLLILLICFYCSSTAFAYGELGGKIKLKDASAVSAQANVDSSDDSDNSSDSLNTSEISDNPFLNSYINGMANMLKGPTNTSFNVQELQKQQMDYAKQQTKGLKD